MPTGKIAYLHPQFIPRRDDRFDYHPAGRRQRSGDRLARPARARRGAAPAQSAHRLDPEHQQLALFGGRAGQPAARGLSRATWTRPARIPRGVHALRLLDGRTRLHPRGAPGRGLRPLRCRLFDRLLPALVARLGRSAAADPLKRAAGRAGRAAARLGPALGAESVPTSLAIFWARSCGRGSAQAHWGPGMTSYEAMSRSCRRASSSRRWPTASERLERRLRQLADALGRDQPLPAPDRRHRPALLRCRRRASRSAFTSARWGSLASFGARAYPGTRRWYGTSGNSFVAVVEFGAAGAGAGGHRRRRERRSRARPISTTRPARYADRRPARGLFPSRPARRAMSSGRYRPGE